jgi:hypothetical protein
LKPTIHISILSQILLAGILPVTSVALHSMGWISIRWMILPNILLLLLCGFHLFQDVKLRTLIIQGWIGGIIAVMLYDVSRIPFVYAGWDDFIPSLGGWITNSDENFFVGYLWRYLGNGAGLGIVFSVLSHYFNFKKLVLAGCLFGIAVCIGLEIVLLSSSSAQGMMFEITPLTCAGGITGHIVYGTTLGLTVQYFRKNKQS